MMELRCERRAQGEVGIVTLEGGVFSAFEEESVPDLRRAVRTVFGRKQGCGGCGQIKPNVDLWAVDPETGEELWLCEACGEW
jgi:hypothetical protein